VVVASCDPCAGLAGQVCQLVPQLRDVTVTVYNCVPEQRLENFKVRYWVQRPESRTVSVWVPTTQQEVRTEQVPVTSYREKIEKYTVRVAVPREEIETYKVQVCRMRPENRVYKVKVPETRQEVHVRKVPVTTYRTVTELVTEKVPSTTCVLVPYEVKVQVPVCEGCTRPCPH